MMSNVNNKGMKEEMRIEKKKLQNNRTKHNNIKMGLFVKETQIPPSPLTAIYIRVYVIH